MTVAAHQIASNSPTKNPMRRRIIGYDFARALAVVGMIIVNFKIVMGASEAGPIWLVRLVGMLEGRAAATFVVLAGVGMSLLSQRARLTHDKHIIAQQRNTLLKRALFLFVVGLLYIPIWPADILHFYGVYIAIGAFLLLVPDKWLWRLAFIFMVAFVVLLFLFDYETGWNWQTLAYVDFWSLKGMVRHLFFNGFHPVFPWMAFLLVGMWLGRQDVHNRALRKKILTVSLGVAIVTELASLLLIRALSLNVSAADAEVIAALFGTKPMPPMPLYLLSGGATAIVVIMLCVALTEKFRTARWMHPLVATGQLALTLYVAHVVIGMGLLEAFGRLENQSLFFAVGSALFFSIISIVFSHFWRKKFNRGPLEWVMRRVT